VIVRILGEGQWDLDASHVDALNSLDDEVEAAVQAGDRETFSQSLDALLNAVRAAGSRLPDDSLVDSELILPHSDATLEEVRDLLADDGLIPG
jgi:hypothetical protein